MIRRCRFSNQRIHQCSRSTQRRLHVSTTTFRVKFISRTIFHKFHVLFFRAAHIVTRSGSFALSVALARGGGLSADYFENVWFFYTPVMSRIDAQIDFDWGDGAITATAADYVSVRWMGRLLPPYSEMFTFYTNADDGVRLWVNDIQLIDRWEGTANMTAAKLSLKARTFYRIKLE